MSPSSVASPVPFSLLSASHDSTVRCWDFRSPSANVLTFEDPNDYPIYCAQYDTSGWKLVAGTAYHSAIRLWDIR